LGEKSSNAGVYILWFFIGFVVAAQIGGRVLDRRGARPAVVWGSVLGAVGFSLTSSPTCH
jgi:MFS family permease